MPSFTAESRWTDQTQQGGIRTKGGLSHVRIDETSSYGFPGTESAVDSGGRYDLKTNWWASKSEILQNLETLNSGDIYGYVGHSTVNSAGEATGLTGDRLFISSSNISSPEIVAAMTSDGNPPGVVVLGSCGSSTLASSLVENGVSVVLGYSENIPGVLAARGVDAAISTLVGGGTINAAVNAANTMIANSAISTTAQMVPTVGQGIDLGLNLRRNGL